MDEDSDTKARVDGVMAKLATQNGLLECLDTIDHDRPDVRRMQEKENARDPSEAVRKVRSSL